MNFLTPAVVLIAFWTGQATPVAKPIPNPASKTAKSKAAGPSDAQLEQDIRARFAKSKISRNHFDVTVSGGIATITGMTDVIQHKGTATRLAKTAGARDVINQIKISEAAREKAARQLSEGRKKAVIHLRGEPRSKP